jgi:hypothetical protein
MRARQQPGPRPPVPRRAWNQRRDPSGSNVDGPSARRAIDLAVGRARTRCRELDVDRAELRGLAGATERRLAADLLRFVHRGITGHLQRRSDHEIVKDKEGQEQPVDKQRAQTAHTTGPNDSVTREATRDQKLDGAGKAGKPSKPSQPGNAR